MLLAVVVALLALLVAGLLRSHAEILRALHALGVDMDPAHADDAGVTTAVGAPTVPTFTVLLHLRRTRLATPPLLWTNATWSPLRAARGSPTAPGPPMKRISKRASPNCATPRKPETWTWAASRFAAGRPSM